MTHLTATEPDALAGHSDLPHWPGTLHECGACKQQMKDEMEQSAYLTSMVQKEF